jgi:tRNA (guanine37-N1)-methyltransferase
MTGFAAEPRGFTADVLTLYPEMFPGPLGLSLSGKALSNGLWSLAVTDYRAFATDRHRSVDDTPAGGGPGMVMRADVVARALDAVSPRQDPRPRLLMSPRGRPLDQAFVRTLAAGPGAVILCGRFEGVDERVIEARGLTELSVGDYVLSGGELAAMVALDAVVRLLPGVMGTLDSGTEESFEAGLLEYPHYTRPVDWEGRTIPPVLVSGDHARIARWRREAAERLTAERRPDLYAAYAARRQEEDESKPRKRGPRRDDGGMTSGRTSSIRNANFEDR